MIMNEDVFNRFLSSGPRRAGGEMSELFKAEDFEPPGGRRAAFLANAKHEASCPYKAAMLTDENGNEYVMVCMLKEKINEMRTQLDEAKESLQKILYCQLGGSIQSVAIGGVDNGKIILNEARTFLERLK